MYSPSEISPTTEMISTNESSPTSEMSPTTEISPTSEFLPASPLDNKPSQLSEMVSDLLLLCNTMSGSSSMQFDPWLPEDGIQRREIKGDPFKVIGIT